MISKSRGVHASWTPGSTEVLRFWSSPPWSVAAVWDAKNGLVQIWQKRCPEWAQMSFSCVGLGSRLRCPKWRGQDLAEKMPRISSDDFLLLSLGSRLGCPKCADQDLAEKMPWMSSDELLLRRFGQPSGMFKVAWLRSGGKDAQHELRWVSPASVWAAVWDAKNGFNQHLVAERKSLV